VLSHHDLNTLLFCTRELYEPATLDQFPARLVSVVRKLVDGEYAVIEEMNVARNRATGLADPPEVRPVDNPALMALFEKNLGAHPLIAHFASTHSQQALTISDFVSRADWMKTELYRDFYTAQGNIEDQLGAFIASRGGLTVATAVGRTRRTFTGRDRQVMTLLQPHIEQAYRNAELLTDLQLSNHALVHELETLGNGVIRLGPGAEVLAINDAARLALEAAFPVWSRRPHRGSLPEPLLAWLAGQMVDHFIPPATASPDFVAPIPAGGRLNARLLRGRRGAVLLMSANRSPDASSADTGRVASLPRRMRQVFDALLQGLSEKQIAERLKLSPHTIHRHVTLLFRRLDVAGRPELMARYVRSIRSR
jgi:DNA-binding CsgD family transcriptional regulator